MSLKRAKAMAAKAAFAMRDAIDGMEDKYIERSDRWKNSKRGKDMKLDIHLCKELHEELRRFLAGIEHNEEEE